VVEAGSHDGGHDEKAGKGPGKQPKMVFGQPQKGQPNGTERQAMQKTRNRISAQIGPPGFEPVQWGRQINGRRHAIQGGVCCSVHGDRAAEAVIEQGLVMSVDKYQLITSAHQQERANTPINDQKLAFSSSLV
jgi:hypothetical protein